MEAFAKADHVLLREELARHFAAASRVRHWQDVLRCRPHLRKDRPDALRILRSDLAFELERIACLSSMLGLCDGVAASQDPAAGKRGRLSDAEYASALTRARWRAGIRPKLLAR